MNASSRSLTEDFDQAISFRRAGTSNSTKSRTKGGGFGRRRGKGPQQFNGIHRRRKKKISW